MVLQDIFDQLQSAELAQYVTGNINPLGPHEDIPEEYRKKLLPLVSGAISVLHRKFLIREESVIVNISSDVRNYRIHTDHALSTANTKKSQYIDDSDSKMNGQVYKIERILDSKGEEILLNVGNEPSSVVSTKYDSIRIPADFGHEIIEVYYRADHPKVSEVLAVATPRYLELDMPPLFLDAIVYYVASRILNPVGSVSEFHAGNNYAAKFERACQEIGTYGFELTVAAEGNQFSNNGWV